MTFGVTVLGTATPHPRPDRPCSGYLLHTAATRIWVDAGTGTLAELQRHTALADVDAIWISHTHADHAADLLPAYYALLFAGLPPHRPTLLGPPGLAHRLETFLASTGPNPADAAFDVRELHDGARFDVGDLSLRTAAVDHGVPAFGLRAAHDGRVFAYSGDTAPCPALDALADGADLFLCEADGGGPDHCAPEDAARAGRGAGGLLITHVGPGLTEAEAAERAAAPVARTGVTYPIGSS
ncbi:MBL fold metallo-hydrolase [Saccharothrix violaceirubra]|uniref:Ribonuclease BN (tRNA processing enzyme) n=1 Tax=Saccharothrix violaceirubra TaxID=413306 RepID=A0A7W7WWG4_9PSEU|nr:MBL fold metallo-hydrolase [Saccharothrix violaceirubra]MBB4965957.1 ribonuclease BN (tRNA processing enzyme) [Saccharothrix violaceirubra]